LVLTSTSYWFCNQEPSNVINSSYGNSNLIANNHCVRLIKKKPQEDTLENGPEVNNVTPATINIPDSNTRVGEQNVENAGVGEQNIENRGVGEQTKQPPLMARWLTYTVPEHLN
jgi:hypothetical protein